MASVTIGYNGGSVKGDCSTVAPPASNTGALVTTGSVGGLSIEGSAALVDWYEFTLPCVDRQPSVLAASVAADFGGLSLSDRGWFGYSSSGYILGTGRIGWDDGRVDMGVHVSLPSAALGVYAAMGGRVYDLYAFVVCLEGHVTRLDIALDSRGDVGDAVELGMVIAAFRAGMLVTRALDVRVMEGYGKCDGQWGLSGRTLYVGAPSSDSRVRFYDKRAEQLVKGVGPASLPAVWTRCEIQLRRERADMVCRVLFERDVQPAAVIRGLVDFRDPGTDGNVTRREGLDWWVAWVAVKAVRLPLVGRSVEIERMRAWIVRQVALSLATVVAYDQGDVSWLYRSLGDAWSRAPGWRQALAERR